MNQQLEGLARLNDELKASILDACRRTYGVDLEASELQLSAPPKADLGDLAFACFPLAKPCGKNPKDIAAQLAGAIEPPSIVEAVSSHGPYLNFTFNRPEFIAEICQAALHQDADYGSLTLGAGKKVMVEYSGPNSNKALHIGHLRNNQIGIALVNILRKAGYQVVPVNIVNDRGIAICQSMLAYQLWGEGKTPHELGIKGDHYVGQMYALYQEKKEEEFFSWLRAKYEVTRHFFDSLDEEEQAGYTKDFELQSELVLEASEMLRLWEAGDPETRQLWETMNGWVYEGFNQTYARQGVAFEKVYYESTTYELGRDIVIGHLASGNAGRDGSGNTVVDLTSEDKGVKVLIRADGTTVYMTQDVGTAVLRFGDYAPLDQLVYVVASEQNHHFQVLFRVLAKFGYPWADKCFHRSYGMVQLPAGQGKMSSRRVKEGGVFLADDLMDRLNSLAQAAITQRTPELEGVELTARAELIGLAALKYFLLSVNPERNMIFDEAQSLEFEGKTGPYLQYAFARICSILRQVEDQSFDPLPPVLDSVEEMTVAKLIKQFPEIISEAAQGYNPSVVAAYVYELAKSFSQFYSKHKVLDAPADIRLARLALAKATAVVLKNSLALLGIEAPERM